jgi:endonuclease V-like protein UPF0215 family
MDHVLNTPQFTQLCKTGFMTKQTSEGRSDLQFYSIDMLELCKGKIVEKQLNNETYRFQVVGISNDDIKEIVKRSPIYSNIIDKLI